MTTLESPSKVVSCYSNTQNNILFAVTEMSPESSRISWKSFWLEPSMGSLYFLELKPCDFMIGTSKSTLDPLKNYTNFTLNPNIPQYKILNKMIWAKKNQLIAEIWSYNTNPKL